MTADLTAALAETLAEHDLAGFSCKCGWRDETAFYHSASRAHVAAEQAKTVRAWLAGLAQEPEMVERVSAAIKVHLWPGTDFQADEADCCAETMLAAFVDGAL